MCFNRYCVLAALILTTFATPAPAQTLSRVSPAMLPIPMPTVSPLPPDQLRQRNPWNLPMTGLWRFHLTHGQIVAGRFVPAETAANGITASSSETANPPQNAFDNRPDTRWCAEDNGFPAWLQADLGKTRRVTGITLAWERATESYQCRVEGSPDGAHWKTLADESKAPGIGGGPLALAPSDARFVRVTVLGSSGGWASLRECQIQIASPDGKVAAWQPPPAPVRAVKPPPDTNAFAQPNFSDRNWDNLAVPSNWEMAGYSVPTYNSVDNTVGLYRRWVVVPSAWAGQRVYWHFDGALDGAEIFINGQKAGYHESGYTAFDVDLTGLVQPGQRNLFAVRVSKTTPSVDCETGDFQCMGGIYRDTSLIAVPQTHVSNITVRTPLDANYRDATLTASVEVMGTPGVAVSLIGTVVSTDGQRLPIRLSGTSKIGANGKTQIAFSAPAKAPRLWSAEKPNLYYLVLQLAGNNQPVEQVEQRFGFRQVEIKNDIVLWNGRPIKCTGVCRHDEWADKGWALTDAQWNKDLALMKAANINAIRTSHYNHAARFLELCEEQGFYILDEVPFCWIGEKNNDPAFDPALLFRAADTLGRDKNRPCVLSWSLGNENGVGKNSQTVIDFVRAQDPTRPAFISQGGDWGPKGQSFQDMHYPTPADVANYVKNDSGKLPANFSEHPHIFYQKETQDYDPGASDLWSETLINTWDQLWQDPTILGSFIWEWQNQGIADKNPNKTRDFYYGKDRLRQENNKGIVDAYRNPKPEYWIVKMAYSPVVIGTRTVSPAGGTCAVPLTNHYSFTDFNELTCHWTAFKGETPLQSGVLPISCAPMQTTTASFPAPLGMTALHLEFDRADKTTITLANLAVANAPSPVPPDALADGGAFAIQDTPNDLTLSNSLQQIAFDKTTGTVLSWRVHGHDLLLGGTALNLGESKAGSEKGYYYAAQPPVLDGAHVTWQRRPDSSVQEPDNSVQVVTYSAVHDTAVNGGASGPILGTLSCTYDIRPNAEISVAWHLDWTAPEIHLWEGGLKLPIPSTLTQMRWQRDSYFTAYPDGHLGEPSGTCRAGDTLFRASKRGLHWLTLTDASGTGLALLAAATPLVARAAPGDAATALFASREVAGPRDFSGVWVSDHDIVAAPGKPLNGAFTLRAIGP